MNPLTNALLGVVFVVVGVAATILMYWLRGRPRQEGREPAER